MTVLVAIGGAVPAQASQTETFGAYDRGSYSNFVYADSHSKYVSDPNETSFTAGRADYPNTADPRRAIVRNFFAFDLAPTDATVTNAVLIVKFNGSAYDSENNSETLALYDVSTNVDTLTAGGDGTAGLGAIYDDLGAGHQYASRTFTAADQGKVIRIPLDATARLQAANGGKLAIGGAITTLSAPPAGHESSFWNQLLFTFSSGDFVTLELTYAGSQPDGWIKNGTSVAGYGVINNTAVGQTLTVQAAAGKTIKYTVTITNAAGINDRYKITAPGSVSGYRVRYLWAGTDITSAVVAGTYRTPTINAAMSADLTVNITVQSTAAAGSSVARLITIQSVGDHRSDAVKAIAKRH